MDKMSIEELIDKAVENQELAGMSVLVIKDKKEAFYHQAGFANLDTKKPYTRDALVRMYSMSKPITGAAVMLLMERGLLGLGEPVSRFLPGFAENKVWQDGKWVQPKHAIVIKELLGMTSGLPYPGGPSQPSKNADIVFADIDKALGTDHELSTVEVANRLGKGGAEYQPGEGWGYGTSADILGAIVEVVSGMSFGDFLNKEFFQPLKMNDTGFYVPKEKADRLADVYEATENGLVFCPTRHLGMTYDRTNKPGFESGGAGIISTIDDYAKFGQMLLNGGKTPDGQQILSEKTVDYFTHPVLNSFQQEALYRNWCSLNGFTYGNLLRRCIDPDMAFMRTWKNEYGWDGWLGTFFANSPESNMTIVMTHQLKDASGHPINEKLRNAIYNEFA